MNNKYDDMLHMPHHVSKTHPRMSMHNRAAQFPPFAALTGFESIIQETSRQTMQRIELDESAKEALNEKLQRLLHVLHLHPKISITFFKPDEKKDGGEYICITGTVKKIDTSTAEIIMTDGAKISIQEILAMQGEIFDKDTIS